MRDGVGGTQMDLGIKGRVALITGGARGLGLAEAEALAAEGVSIAVNDVDRDAADQAVSRLKELGVNAAAFIGDAADEAVVVNLTKQVVGELGRLDILVNNAGIGIMGKTVEEVSGDEFRATLETNLFGVFYGCHYAVPMMRRRGGGYIINISSLAGQNPHPKMAAYNASKYGLNGFSEALMQEVRQDNIKVTYICPGSVNTHFGNDTPSEEKAWQIQPEDIAEIVIGLLAMDQRALPSKIELRPSKPPVR